MSTDDPSESLEPAEDDPDVPDWDDEYVDRVSDRLMFNYDLAKDYVLDAAELDAADGLAGGGGTERFTLYGEMRMHHQKHFFHPLLSFAHHDTFEHLFVRRADGVTVADLESFVSLGHDLADEWIDADEEHYATEFTFVAVTDEVTPEVRSFVADFRDRTLIRRGFHGHYEVHLLVVAPDREDLVASEEAGVEEAFRLWDPIEEEEVTWLDLIRRRLQV